MNFCEFGTSLVYIVSSRPELQSLEKKSQKTKFLLHGVCVCVCVCVKVR